jgi:hypothetical protein
MNKGVMTVNAEDPVLAPLLPMVTFTGIITAIPTSPRTRKILRSMRATLRKMTASMPILSIKKLSLALLTGLTQLNRPFPSGGGAWSLSAFFNRGAYTIVFLGRTKQNRRARAALNPRDVAREAQKALY